LPATSQPPREKGGGEKKKLVLGFEFSIIILQEEGWEKDKEGWGGD